jgi:hypothetical protein
MAIGETGDFRTIGFKQIERFPGQGSRGGVGSAFLPQLTPPAGSTNSVPKFPALTLPQLPNSTFSLPAFNFTAPQLPQLPVFTPTTGASGATSLSVGDGTNTYTGVNTITVSGALTLTSTGPTAVDIYGSGGGGGGGATAYYGKITAATQTAGYAYWTYTVQVYLAGVAGTSYTAFNLLEINNTGTVAYGYAVTGGDRLTGTSYYIRKVPLGTWVRIEQTNAVNGTANFYFSAPNYMDGTC